MEYLLMKYSQHHTMNKDSGGKRRERKGKRCPKAPDSMGRRWPCKAVQRKKNMNGRQ